MSVAETVQSPEASSTRLHILEVASAVGQVMMSRFRNSLGILNSGTAFPVGHQQAHVLEHGTLSFRQAMEKGREG